MRLLRQELGTIARGVIMQIENDMDRLCCNCTFFFQDISELGTTVGVCLNNVGEFEPYIDEVIKDSDFSICKEIYDKMKFDGDKPPCPLYEEIEMAEEDEMDEEDETSDELTDEEFIERVINNIDIEKNFEYLESANESLQRQALSNLEVLIRFGKKEVGYRLLDSLVSLKPAGNISEAHGWAKIIDTILCMKPELRIVDGFMKILRKTPSSATTRGVFNAIFDGFRKYPYEMIREPLSDFMYSGICKPKLKARIEEVLESSYDFEHGRPAPWW